jgi:hypothetical protein
MFDCTPSRFPDCPACEPTFSSARSPIPGASSRTSEPPVFWPWRLWRSFVPVAWPGESTGGRLPRPVMRPASEVREQTQPSSGSHLGAAQTRPRSREGPHLPPSLEPAQRTDTHRNGGRESPSAAHANSASRARPEGSGRRLPHAK